MRKLDRTDIGILNSLQENARITNADLARSVNLSPTPCFNRVKAMGPQVEVIAFPRNTAKSLLEAADRYQPLDRKFMIRSEALVAAETAERRPAAVAAVPPEPAPPAEEPAASTAS